MRYRKLGNTGLSVSEIGFGTIPILRGNVPVLPEHLDPDTETAVDIMMYAFGMGCNFYDTAIPEEYGDAEYKLGIFAQRIGREKIIISDKARFYSGNRIYEEVIRSCKNLNTEPDIYFVHQVDDESADEVFGKYGALDALCDLKKEGIIRFTGIATHHYSVLKRAVSDERADILQASGNILERGVIDRITPDILKYQKPLILNKVYGAGTLLNCFEPHELISGVLSMPFSSALIGIGTKEHADAAMKYEYPEINYSADEVTGRLSEVFEPIGCIRCQKCMCPYGFDVQNVFRQYNYCHLGKRHWALNKINMDIKEFYDSCRKCTKRTCMKDCPCHLKIPELIEKIYDMTNRIGDTWQYDISKKK